SELRLRELIIRLNKWNSARKNGDIKTEQQAAERRNQTNENNVYRVALHLPETFSTKVQSRPLRVNGEKNLKNGLFYDDAKKGRIGLVRPIAIFYRRNTHDARKYTGKVIGIVNANLR